MTLAPLIQASPVIQIHAYAAIAAFVLGSVQMLAPKGTISHRKAGWAWAVLMIVVAVSSLFIHTIRTFGPFSLIHLLSILVLVQVPLAIWYVRTGQISGHRKTMTSMFVFALVVAGFFTFMPGRIMHNVLFGG
jgi:uncharacterized membrane protein